jgi:hypothetical protein
VFVITFLNNNNALIFDFSPSMKRKIHLIGTLGGQKKKNSSSFQKRQEKPWKNNQKTGIFTHNHFTTNSTFWFYCNSKTNHCKYLKFSPNVYISVIYLRLNFSKFLEYISKYSKYIKIAKICKEFWSWKFIKFLWFIPKVKKPIFKIYQNRENLQGILKLKIHKIFVIYT